MYFIRGRSLYLAVTSIVITAALACTTAQADVTGSSASLVFGQKSLSSSDWAPVEKQSEWGAILVLGKEGYPVALLIGYTLSEESGNVLGLDVKGETSEFLMGVRKGFASAPTVIPYVEGGLVFLSARVEVSGLSESDSSTGYWFGAGVDIPVGERLRVGLGLRYSAAEVSWGGGNYEGGGTHFGITAGVGF